MDVRPKQKTVKRFRASAPITALQCKRMGHVNNTCPYFEMNAVDDFFTGKEGVDSMFQN